ncbi:cytochrome p450 domain-containing protein [Ditylenchus destructor]|nr:cytochrome p450 domain-containing protein [Ditylenchus destructor]
MFSQHGFWPTLDLNSDPEARWVQWLNPILDRLYTVSLTLAPAAIAVYILSYLKRLSQFPPGPWPLPVIGNFLQMDTANPHRSFVKWQEKYGPIYTVWLPKPVVVIADFDELQRVFRENNDANDRPMSFLYGIFTRHQTDGDGIILSQGERWKRQRSFALQAFRHLGMGRSRAEAIINHHKNELLTRLDGYCQEGLEEVSDVHFLLAFCFGNVIQDFVMGRHYNYNHPEFLWLKECIDKTLKGVASIWMLIVDSYPWMRFFIPAYWRYKKHGFELQQFFLEEIGRHIQTFDASAEPDNFIDAYLKDMHEQNDVNLT